MDSSYLDDLGTALGCAAIAGAVLCVVSGAFLMKLTEFVLSHVRWH